MPDATATNPVEDPPAVVSVDAAIRRLDREVALITTAVAAKKVWYRDASTITALVAVLISALTFFHTRAPDTEAKKNELHATLRQISASLVQLEESKLKYPDKASDIQHIYFDQTALLAKRAFSLIQAVGSDATATDVIGVANFLRFANEPSLAQSLLESAEFRVNDVVEYTSLYNALGVLGILRGDLEQGNRYFQKAADVLKEYPRSSPGLVRTMTFGTQMEWTRVLNLAGECQAASAHIDQAGKLLLEIRNPNILQMIKDYNNLRETVTRCTPTKSVPGLAK